MLAKDLSFISPIENIAYDDVLLSMAEEGLSSEVLRLWESPSVFIVLGRTSKVEDDVFKDSAAEDEIDILRRSSGGGTVVQGPGCLNYSLILSKQSDPVLADLRKSYELILNKISGVMERLNLSVEFKPISDLVISSSMKKFSGNAQRRARKYILHHGTLLYSFDLNLISRYLKEPKDMPEYRHRRSHEEFVCNINKSLDHIKKEFWKCFEIKEVERIISAKEKICLRELLDRNFEKYYA